MRPLLALLACGRKAPSAVMDRGVLLILDLPITSAAAPVLPHIDAPGSNKKIILATRTQATKLREVGGCNQSSSTKNSQKSRADLRPSKPASILRRKDFWPQGKPRAGRQTL